MIETISDFLSIAVMVIVLFASIYFFYIGLVQHRERTFKDIESRYYQYYENANDEDEGEYRNEPYFEE